MFKLCNARQQLSRIQRAGPGWDLGNRGQPAQLFVSNAHNAAVALIKRERLAGRVPVSHDGVVAKVWREGTGRHLAVARLLAGTDIAAPDDRLRRRASALLARSGLADAIDVAVASLAADGEDLFILRSWRPPGTGSGCGRTRRLISV